MTRSGPLGRWDPFRPLDMLATLFSTAAAIPPVSSGAAMAYRTLFMTLRRLVVGRRITVHLDEGSLSLVVTGFDSRLDVRNLSVGQLDDVRIEARDLVWDDNRLDRATVLLRNVHFRPSTPPVVVAAPVELTVDLPAAVVGDVIRWAMPRLAGEIGPDGVARLHWARRPLLGNIEVDAQVDGSTLWLQPRGVVLRRRRWALSERTPAYPIQLPPFPHGLELTDVRLGPDTLHLTGVLPEWRMAVPQAGLETIITQLSSVGRQLNFTRAQRWW
ncbi:LmeA family phospholipid-binding protein [Mycolicibacillus trivialis]|nr:LmeA family phospholipid-binding protein [Mycolicibacillus trivialis]